MKFTTNLLGLVAITTTLLSTTTMATPIPSTNILKVTHQPIEPEPVAAPPVNVLDPETRSVEHAQEIKRDESMGMCRRSSPSQRSKKEEKRDDSDDETGVPVNIENINKPVLC